MASMGKALNKKSFYAGNQVEGGAPDIAMPDYNQEAPITQSAPDPWQAQQQANPFGAVPEQLPDDVAKEMANQENPEQESESLGEEVEETAQVQQKNAKSAQESFRDVRAAKEKAERERDALMQQMLNMQRQQYQQPEKPQQQVVEEEPDIDFDIDPDSLVEGKHVKKLAAAYKSMQKQMREYQNQTQAVTVEARIRATYPDFEKVVSQENIAILNEQYPEVAATLRDTPDMFNKAATAYSVIKNFGIHKQTALAPERAKAIANSQKPRPLASVSPQQGDSPLSKANAFANGMTDELKEQLRKEMFTARRNH